MNESSTICLSIPPVGSATMAHAVYVTDMSPNHKTKIT